MRNVRNLLRWGIVAVPFLLVAGVVARGHFGMIIPERDIVTEDAERTVGLDLLFAHPFEGSTMDMARPKQFGVVIRGQDGPSLVKTLAEVRVGGHRAWRTTYKIQRPGDHVFYVEPEPYWEPAEGKYIIHYTKVVVNGMGMEEGWDHEVGLKTEIIPLVRPYGLYTGNLFRGIVKVDRKPVPYAEIEVEYYNRGGTCTAPKDPFVTQVIKADGAGVFAYAMPRQGWWGFAALSDPGWQRDHDGRPAGVEIGAVMWVFCVDMK
jgi:cobalt/nickel transport protein